MNKNNGRIVNELVNNVRELKGTSRELKGSVRELKKMNRYIEKRLHLHYALLDRFNRDHEMLIEWMKEHEVRIRKIER